jgi:hypothetical protein
MKAVERATANKSLHTPNLGGKATTKQVNKRLPPRRGQDRTKYILEEIC